MTGDSLLISHTGKQDLSQEELCRSEKPAHKFRQTFWALFQAPDANAMKVLSRNRYSKIRTGQDFIMVKIKKVLGEISESNQNLK